MPHEQPRASRRQGCGSLVRQQIAAAARYRDFAIDDDIAAMRELQGVESILLDQEHSQPVAGVQIADRRENLPRDQGRQPERGLVHEQNVWLGHEGTAEGQQAARAVAIDLMGTLHAAVGDLNKIKRIVKVMSLVNSTGDFTEQHLVTNGCSELLGQVFGAAGAHARSAFGVAQIPMGACVEIELIAELA